jgi:tetratricopeptide (TPR) repeat protein
MRFVMLSLLIVFSLSAQDKLVLNETDELILGSIHNADLAQAENLLNQQINSHPHNPRYYLLKTSMYFHARYFQPQVNRDSIRSLLGEWAQKTIDIAEKQKETTLNKFYLGSAYSYRSVYDILNSSYWDGYFSARKGRNYLEDVIEEDPDYYDAYVHLGVLEYFAATRVTGWRSSLAWLIGMTGDRDKGIEYIEKTARNGQINKDMATFIAIALFRFYEVNPEKATEYVTAYHNKYPNNTYIENQYLAMEFQRLVDEKGAEYLVENIDILRQRFRINSDGTLNNLGYSYVSREDYKTALVIFKLNLNLFPEVANCYDSLAEGYMLSGNREEAIKFYRKAYKMAIADQEMPEQEREGLIGNIKEKMNELDADLEPGV